MTRGVIPSERSESRDPHPRVILRNHFLAQTLEHRRDEAAERAVAHHEDHVAGPSMCDDALHQVADLRRRIGVDPLRAQLVHDLAYVELLVEGHLVVRLGYADRGERRTLERARVLALVDVTATGVGARLEHGPQPAVGVAL